VEIKQLEAFVYVAELGSFTKAADILGMRQPVLSRTVRQLEVDLRQHLLVRTGRGVTLTAAGRVLLEHGATILQQVERARNDLACLQGSVDGHFTIGLAPSVARSATVALVKRFQRDFPQARISVVDGLSSYLAEWLQMGRLDAAIMHDTAQATMIDKRVLLTEELVLVSLAHGGEAVPERIDFARIADYPLVIPGWRHAIRAQMESEAAKLNLKLNIAIEVDAVAPILDLVLDGFGHAVLPRGAVRGHAHEARLHLAHIGAPTLCTRLVMGTSRQHPLSRIAALAVAALEREFLALGGPGRA
jgi:LysR family nitrogen assimilation transcriptional regulator